MDDGIFRFLRTLILGFAMEIMFFKHLNWLKIQ